MKKIVGLMCLLIQTFTSPAQIDITAEDARKHINHIVRVCGRVSEGQHLDTLEAKQTLLNMGAPYPDQLFSIAINNISRPNFPFKPEEYYLNKRVCVVGRVAEFEGKPQIVVLSPAEILVDANDTASPVVPSPVSAKAATSDTSTGSTVSNIDTSSTRANGRHADNAIKRSDTTTANKNPANAPSGISGSPSAQPNRLGSTSASSKPINAPGADVKKEGTVTAKPGAVTPAKVADPGRTENAYPIKITSNLNLRAEPKEGAEIVEKLKAGSVVLVLRSANGWSYVSYQVRSSGELLKGYIQNRILK
jgi:micrococcal nuclease